MILTVTDLFLSIQICVLAYVISNILTKDGFLLDWYLDILIRINKNYPMIAKPLGYCDKCFAGQLAFWIWIFNRDLENVSLFQGFFLTVCFISMTILIMYIFNSINNLIRWYIEKISRNS